MYAVLPGGLETRSRVLDLKLGKDPALLSSYRPISLLDTIGKLYEEILLSRILHEVSERGLLRDEQFGFRPKHSTALQLTSPVESFQEFRLPGCSQGLRHCLGRWPPIQAHHP
jgi:hypothetical protein